MLYSQESPQPKRTATLTMKKTRRRQNRSHQLQRWTFLILMDRAKLKARVIFLAASNLTGIFWVANKLHRLPWTFWVVWTQGSNLLLLSNLTCNLNLIIFSQDSVVSNKIQANPLNLRSSLLLYRYKDSARHNSVKLGWHLLKNKSSKLPLQWASQALFHSSKLKCMGRY